MMKPCEVSDKNSRKVSESRDIDVVAGCLRKYWARIVGRTVDWLSKVENNRIDLNLLSVIRRVGEALDVTISDHVGEPTLLEWKTPTAAPRQSPLSGKRC